VLLGLVWGAAAVIALGALVVLGYELFGHLARLRRTLLAARQELLPQVERLTSPGGTGRHRAGAPRA
jgi:hypothetical protein